MKCQLRRSPHGCGYYVAIAVFACLSTVLIAPAAHAQNSLVSFAGKQIRLLIGFSPTTYGYDTYGRPLAKYIGKYLPGGPVIVPQNRPGAGSLSLASYMAHAAPRDGSEIAIVGRGVAMEPLLDAPVSPPKFDSTAFAWLGSMNNEVGGFFVREPGPVASFADVLKGAVLKVGSTGAGGDQQIFTQALNALFGTKLNLVAGYPGTQELMLAIERGGARRHRRLLVERGSLRQQGTARQRQPEDHPAGGAQSPSRSA